MLKMGFVMPAVVTIQKWHTFLRFEAGVSEIVLNILRKKVDQMKESDRRCVLLFDEMSCKKELEYNVKDDVIYGFKDLGESSRKSKVSSSVLFLMLRGLNLNWKQGVAYFAGPISGKELSFIIKDAVQKLLNIGFDIISISCDQGSNNRLSYKEMGSSRDNPFITISDKKIYTVYDTPHLIKSVRNILYSYDILVSNKKVSWNIIRKVYNIDNETIRAMHKLRDEHIDPKLFLKMNVALATQVFSHSVSSAIFTAVSMGCFSDEEQEVARNTAEFISKMNTMFDYLNSVSQFSKNPKFP